jgi:hypothetical protein
MKDIIDQIRSTVTFCGFALEAITPHQSYVSIVLRSKKRFRKKNYVLGVSKSLTGLLAAERELSRTTKDQILLLDPVNNLLEPTLTGKIKLFHDLDQLQVFLNE